MFAVSFRTPDRTGRHGTVQFHDLLTGSVPQGLGCVTSFSVRAPDAKAGARLRVVLDPRRLGTRWCEGTYRGRIAELQTPVCSRGELCPSYVLVRRQLGPFTFRVYGTPARDTAPPAFGGLRRAFACTPGPQRPGQTTPFTLSWEAATDNVTPRGQIDYDIYLSTRPFGERFSRPRWTTAPGATRFRTPGLASHGSFYFVVRARDLAGNEDRNTVEQRGVDPCL
jgi:hypothetical protein